MNEVHGRDRQVLFSGFVGLPSTVSVGGFARAGYDFVVLDRVVIGSDIMHLLAKMGAEIAQARTLAADQQVR